MGKTGTVTNPWSDLDRPPLVPAALRSALLRPGSMWTGIDVVPETGSTNADLLSRASAPEGTVLVAELQTGGRGRLDRSWTSPPRAGLTFSVLLRPAVPMAVWGWLPLLTGLSLARAVGRVGEVPAYVKWPNDLLLGSSRLKAAGILMQASGGAVVVGIGLNVTTRRDELPRPDATSLALEDAACTDRDPLLRAVLRQFAEDYASWQRAGGDPVSSGLHADYTAACDTLGRYVTATLPAGEPLQGVATAVDAEGRLVLHTDDDQQHAVAAGDVVHLAR